MYNYTKSERKYNFVCVGVCQRFRRCLAVYCYDVRIGCLCGVCGLFAAIMADGRCLPVGTICGGYIDWLVSADAMSRAARKKKEEERGKEYNMK